MKKTLLGLAAAMMFVAPSFAEDCKFVVGWEPWEPYQMKDASGNVVGFDMEFVAGVAKHAGCTVDAQELTWARIIEGIKNGTIDMTGGASLTEERKEFARFSDAYRKEKMTLFIRKGEGDKFKLSTLEDVLALGMRIGVTADYEYGDLYAKLMEKPEFKALVDTSASAEISVKKLLANRIDGYMDDELVGIAAAKKNNAMDKIEANPVEVTASDIHILTSKKSVSEEMLAKINQAIKDYVASAEYQALLDKYFK